MSEGDWLAEQFEQHRGNLRAVAIRMLGTASDADDAVQETWIRLHRSDTDGVENMGAWLTTVVGRVCLDMLRSRRTRREDPLDEQLADRAADPVSSADPEQQALVADSVGLALLVVLETLAPAERLAFVLHDMFAVPFDDIAGIIGRSPAATRQLASRARRRVRDSVPSSDAGLGRHERVVRAFLAASRGGDFEALVSALHPEVVLRADAAAVDMGAEELVVGVELVARTFAGRARGARLALVDSAVGLVWANRGEPRVLFEFSFEGSQIVAIDLVADPERLLDLDPTYLAP